MQPVRLSLPAIAALTRAGACARAWELFVASGWDSRTDDPAALSLKGRLLKDRARAARGTERTDLFAAAAAAYAAANALSPAPYRAINVATARLLAGDPASAAQSARDVLVLLDQAGPATDTPYYLAATRAEALLLLDDQAGAERALAEAVTADPDGWDDRAVTLGQLREILRAQAVEAPWLSRFTPPTSVHFAGHMGIVAGGPGETALAAATDAVLARHGVGFGWGALAAGSDIVIAERLVAAGAELHVVLPCPPQVFAAQSVVPAGGDWLARYERLLDQAASLRVAGYAPAAVHDPLATQHAGILAIGGTLLNARRLGAACLQLLVEDETGGGPNTARQAALWPSGNQAQERVRIARDAAVEAMFPPEAPDPARQLMTQVAIRIDLPAQPSPSTGLRPEIDQVAQAIAAANLPQGSIRTGQGRWDLLLDDRDQALALVASLLALPGDATAIGVHQAIVTVLADPASGASVAYGPESNRAGELMAMAPAGAALASDALAVVLAASPASSLRSELYHLGDAETGGPVHMLLPAA
ncbi:MAG: tetratricopeptide repeat-containing protein [Pseudomonadota bacterium]|nr:tetratricopeptide repeat-containing protein [Pseudomonadota bacterium]